MNETLLKYFQKLKTEYLTSSGIPKTLLSNTDFVTMLNNGIISCTKVGRGKRYELNESKRSIYEQWFQNTFPNKDIEVIDKASSIAKYKDSKQSKAKNNIIFLRGFQEVLINDAKVDLNFHTKQFNLFACVLQNLKAEKICFVENKETFLRAEEVIAKDYIFIHTYGRIGGNLLAKIEVKSVLVFSDYDYIGLNEYLKCKEYFPQTEFFMPDNYDELLKYTKEITKNRKYGQKASERVKNSNDEVVTKIRENLQTSQKFLEQEILLYKF